MAISGTLSKDIFSPLVVLNFADLHPVPARVRIESAVFAIQEKMGCVLWWDTEDGDVLILPLESRGKLDFESPMQGLHAPKGARGIKMSTFLCNAEKHFLIMLDMTKQ